MHWKFIALQIPYNGCTIMCNYWGLVKYKIIVRVHSRVKSKLFYDCKVISWFVPSLLTLMPMRCLLSHCSEVWQQRDIAISSAHCNTRKWAKSPECTFFDGHSFRLLCTIPKIHASTECVRVWTSFNLLINLRSRFVLHWIRAPLAR